MTYLQHTHTHRVLAYSRNWLDSIQMSLFVKLFNTYAFTCQSNCQMQMFVNQTVLALLKCEGVILYVLTVYIVILYVLPGAQACYST